MARIWERRPLEFQFTLPRGERQTAMVRRASASECFNSRSRVGSDRRFARLQTSRCSFQFTLPRGERPDTLHDEHDPQKFQFTLPRGERPSANK